MSLITYLRSKFADPVIKEKCCGSSRRSLEGNNQATRVFDEFPRLLLPMQFSECRQQFKQLLEPKILNKGDILRFEMNIIRMGCVELLDSQGHIKQELIDLMGWEKYTALLDSRDVVSAYVGAVNMQIIKNLSDLTENQQDLLPDICNFVSKNYRQWIYETLSKSDFTLAKREEEEDSSLFMELIRFSQKHPAAVTSIATGFFAVAVLLGLSFYNAATKEQGEEEPGAFNSKSGSIRHS